MRTLTASAFVLEALGGFLDGHNIVSCNLLANVMRAIFTTSNTFENAELVNLGVIHLNVDLGCDITGHAIRELMDAEVDLVNGQQIHVVVADLVGKFIMPLCEVGVTPAQTRLNTTLCDLLVQHLTYFGYWYRMDHYPVELH